MNPPDWRIIRGDCREALRAMEADSVDAIICDPPYEIAFMGRAWDNTGIAYDPATWREALRVAKPGAYLLAFGAARTYHRIACAIEDAGWEIRDSIHWVFGSGFPKSLNLAKAFDRKAGALAPEGSAFTVAGYSHAPDTIAHTAPSRGYSPPAPVTDEAKAWEGWGTALKPAHEPIIMARKPLVGTLVENVRAYGTGAINVDAGRVGTADTRGKASKRALGLINDDSWNPREVMAVSACGRWPANVILSHAPGCTREGTRTIKATDPNRFAKTDGGAFAAFTERAPVVTTASPDGTEAVEVWACVPGCPIATMDAQSGTLTSGANPTSRGGLGYKGGAGQSDCKPARGVDSGGASRFFNTFPPEEEDGPPFYYVAKAATREREQGLEDRERRTVTDGRDKPADNPRQRGATERANTHPTVKPIGIMRHLVRLVCKPGALVVDPFAGSGTTGIAAVLEGVRFVGAELDATHADIAEARIGYHARAIEEAAAKAASEAAKAAEREAARQAREEARKAASEARSARKSAPIAPAVDPRQAALFPEDE